MNTSLLGLLIAVAMLLGITFTSGKVAPLNRIELDPFLIVMSLGLPIIILVVWSSANEETVGTKGKRRKRR